jgi:hypothetical protein
LPQDADHRLLTLLRVCFYSIFRSGIGTGHTGAAARGLVNVEALAAADRLVTALHPGVGDFAASIGARSTEIATAAQL